MNSTLSRRRFLGFLGFLGFLAASPLLATPAVSSAWAVAEANFRFRSRDGLPIAYSRWISGGPLLGMVQIAHGMGDHIGRYKALAQTLTAAGFAVYGNDHRGHGRTAGSPD